MIHFLSRGNPQKVRRTQRFKVSVLSRNEKSYALDSSRVDNDIDSEGVKQLGMVHGVSFSYFWKLKTGKSKKVKYLHPIIQRLRIRFDAEAHQ